ncbi:MAG TPA: S8 family peptidase [Bacteroidota bacterium]|nr:S8 family peptidase [Bacteroidota bacterium]
MAQQQKVGSGLLFQHALKKQSAVQIQGVADAGIQSSLAVAVYQEHYPSIGDLANLERLGVRCVPESWIPPLENHPLGFFIAKVPVDKIADVLSLASVMKMDSAEEESVPMNNTAAIAAKATLAWASGWTGSGVKVAVLDSGLDYTLPKTELPDSMWYRNYAFYPDSINNTISNTKTGHGTHVTGTVLGKGGYSTSPVLNTGNGGGAYKGMAPDAKLVFLKIGRVTTSSATSAAMVAAIKSAVDTFHVRVINMSYGGWDAYHDGSNAEAQATDYAYGKGVACFYAAGNNAADGRHYSGTVNANDSTDFIQINVSGAGTNNTALWFNLVWADGAARNNLSLSYYDASHNLMGNIIQDATTQSPRGTESKYSLYNRFLSPGSGTYYLRVKNPSASAQTFHIYDDWGTGVVQFASPDPGYTVASPAHADHAFAVAAYVSRSSWTSYTGDTWNYGYTNGAIAPFSNRGPRIDGLQKPNIAAPGSELVSIRDRDVYTVPDMYYWIDNDGVAGGDANYYAMQGTSMASPVAAGCAALLVQHTPSATPQQIYDAISLAASADANTGAVPNSTWGAGKLDINTAINDPALPVELASFTSHTQKGSVVLAWRTATETNNYGFEIERKQRSSAGQSKAVWEKIGFAPGNGTTSSAHDYVFTDHAPSTGLLSYRLKQIDRDGHFCYSAERDVQAEGVPAVFSMAQNYPNPFNPATMFRFSLPVASRVRLVVYDVLGRETAVLIDRMIEAGAHTTEWNASQYPSGVYFFRLEAGEFSATKKLLLQK